MEGVQEQFYHDFEARGARPGGSSVRDGSRGRSLPGGPPERRRAGGDRRAGSDPLPGHPGRDAGG